MKCVCGHYRELHRPDCRGYPLGKKCECEKYSERKRR